MTVIAPIPPISSQTYFPNITTLPPVPEPVSAASKQRFQSLMQQSHAAPPLLYGSHHPSAVGRLVQAEDHMLQNVLDRSNAFAAHAAEMDVNTVVAGQMQLMGEMTAAMTHLTIGTSVAQSGKSAIQNLFKNQ